MTTIPDAAIAVIAAAIEDYRLTTPTHEQTPREAAQRAVEYLTSSGWGIHVPHSTPTPRTAPIPITRVACPACTARYVVTADGRIRRHGPPSHPCPGSGTPARATTTA